MTPNEQKAREWLDGAGGAACVASDQEPAVELLAALLDEVAAQARREEREALQMLAGAAGDLLAGWDAHRQLASGFGGMGHNISIEAAGKYGSITYWTRLRRYYDAAVALLQSSEQSR